MDMPSEFPVRVITAEVRHNLFLAFKEALHNAIKHAGASEVRISLTVEPAAFTLVVEDNGKGFVSETILAGTPHGQPSHGTGNGLANMRQRLAEIGGRCEIESAPGKGTKVTFTSRVERVFCMRSPEAATCHPFTAGLPACPQNWGLLPFPKC